MLSSFNTNDNEIINKLLKIKLCRRDIGEEVTALAWDGDQAIVGGGRGSIQV